MVKVVQQEHKAKLATLMKELEQVSLKQAQQLKDIEHLRTEAKSGWEKREMELKESHKRDMMAAEQAMREEAERCQTEVALAKSELERAVQGLRETHRAELEAVRLSLEEERGAEEGRRWEERERVLRDEMRAREEELTQRTSSLSGELRVARDHLMLARERETELEKKFEITQAELCGVQDQFEEGEREREGLRENLAVLRAKTETAEEEGEKLRKRLSERAGERQSKHTHTHSRTSANRRVCKTGGGAQTDRGRPPVSADSSA